LAVGDEDEEEDEIDGFGASDDEVGEPDASYMDVKGQGEAAEGFGFGDDRGFENPIYDNNDDEEDE